MSIVTSIHAKLICIGSDALGLSGLCVLVARFEGVGLATTMSGKLLHASRQTPRLF